MSKEIKVEAEIKVNINGQTLSLSREDAVKLRAELDAVLGGKLQEVPYNPWRWIGPGYIPGTPVIPDNTDYYPKVWCKTSNNTEIPQARMFLVHFEHAPRY